MRFYWRSELPLSQRAHGFADQRRVPDRLDEHATRAPRDRPNVELPIRVPLTPKGSAYPIAQGRGIPMVAPRMGYGGKERALELCLRLTPPTPGEVVADHSHAVIGEFAVEVVPELAHHRHAIGHRFHSHAA